MTTKKEPGRAGYESYRVGHYRVELSGPVGSGYVHYEITVPSGERIAAGGISRLNYTSYRAHLAAIRAEAVRIIKGHEAVAKADGK